MGNRVYNKICALYLQSAFTMETLLPFEILLEMYTYVRKVPAK